MKNQLIFRMGKGVDRNDQHAHAVVKDHLDRRQMVRQHALGRVVAAIQRSHLGNAGISPRRTVSSSGHVSASPGQARSLS